MSIQWTFTAGFLYMEIIVVIIMLLPIFSPRKWNRFFKSRLFSMFQQHAAMYFYVLLGVLCLFLLDAVKEMRKYSHNFDVAHVHISSEMKGSVKLFRAQRNFYITGFTIFLAFVIRRLVTMLIIQDELTIKSESIVLKAKATLELAKPHICVPTRQATENINEIREQLNEANQHLNKEKKRCYELEEETKKWKMMYLEAEKQMILCSGKGDEK